MHKTVFERPNDLVDLKVKLQTYIRVSFPKLPTPFHIDEDLYGADLKALLSADDYSAAFVDLAYVIAERISRKPQSHRRAVPPETCHPHKHD